MEGKEILAKLAQYRFYHTIKLTENIYTSGSTNPLYPQIQKLVLEAMENTDFAGKRVLDIGCRDGLFCFKAEKLGASEVIGIDNDLSKGAVEFLIPYFKSKVKMYELNLFDLTADKFGLFDIVIFPGVLYHLRYPFWGLKIIKDVLKENGKLILETAIWLGNYDHAMLFCPISQDSPYEPTSCTFFNEKGLVDSLSSLGLTIESIRYLSKQSGPETIIKKMKRLIRKVYKKPNGFNIESITRAVFVCNVSRENGDKSVKEYWDATHKMHTE